MRLDSFFLSLGQKLEKFFPKLSRQLKTAKMDESPEEYLSKCLKRAFKLSVPSGVSLIAAGLITSARSTTMLGVASIPVLFVMGFLTFEKLPQIRTNRRTRKLEKDLPYALRDVLIEIKSGIPLYNALNTVSEGYGEASKEIQLIIKDIDGGKPMVEAIEDSIVRNPSEQYRRAMWQLNNSLKSGTDISVTLESVVDSIIEDQKLMIKKYGKELNPYILVYLLMAVVGPSLGITMLIVMSSFTGIAVDRNFYLAILGLLIIMQIMFLNLIKTRRPEIKT